MRWSCGNTRTLSSRWRSTDAGWTSVGLNGVMPIRPDAISSRMLLSLNTMALPKRAPRPKPWSVRYRILT